MVNILQQLTTYDRVQAELSFLRQKVKAGNAPFLDQLRALREKEWPLKEPYIDLRDKVETEAFDIVETQFQKIGIIDTFGNKEACKEFDKQFKRLAKKHKLDKLRKPYHKNSQKISALYQKIGKQHYKHTFKVADMTITAKGFQYLNGDTDSLMYQRTIKIKIGNRKYFHYNVFDGGDVAGREGFKAFWYYRANPAAALEDCYVFDAVEEANEQKIADLFYIGIRM